MLIISFIILDIIVSKQQSIQSSQAVVVSSSNGILNLITTDSGTSQPTTNSNFLQSSVASNNASVPVTSSSKLVLVPKDFSLQRSSTTTAPISSSITPTTSITLINGGAIVTNSNNKRPLPEQNGSPAKVGLGGVGNTNTLLKTVTGVEPAGNTPNKRNRINGTVIGVSEMIAFAAQQSNQQQQNQSKFVTGSFDLEEHIRALPQLADTHLINALQLRNADGTKGATTAANLVMVSSTPVMATTTFVPSGFNHLKNTSVGMLAKTVTPTTVLLQSQTHSPPPNITSLSNIPLHIQPENLSYPSTTGAKIENAVPLRLVTSTTNSISVPTRMQVSPSPGQSVLIKLAPGQSIAGANVVMAGMAPMTMTGSATGDGSILPLIIRGAPTTMSGTSIAMATTNKPVDLSMTIQLQFGGTVSAVRTLPTQAYLSAPMTIPTVTGASTGAVIVTSSAPSSLGGQSSLQAPACTSPSSSIYSTVISSQGSINQCDGLAALAEIALAQRNIS